MEAICFEPNTQSGKASAKKKGENWKLTTIAAIKGSNSVVNYKPEFFQTFLRIYDFDVFIISR